MISRNIYDQVIQQVSASLKEQPCEDNMSVVFKPIVSASHLNVCGYEVRDFNTSRLDGEEHLSSIRTQIQFLKDTLLATHISEHNSLGTPLYVSFASSLLTDDQFIEYVQPLLTGHRQINSLFFLIEIDETTHFPKLSNLLANSGLLKIRNCMLKWAYHKPSLHQLGFYLEFSRWMGIPLVSSRVQQPDDLEQLCQHQVPYLMGAYVAPPINKLSKNNNVRSINSLKPIHDTTHLNNKTVHLVSTSMPAVSSIISYVATVSLGHMGFHVKELFNQNPLLEGVVVISDSAAPVGLIMREQYYRNLSRQYGYEIFMNRPISLIMTSTPLIVDAQTPIDEVGEMAMKRSLDHLYDYVIVQKDSQYQGVVSIRELLIKISEMNINIAKYTNPLTGLPGNKLITEKIHQAISMKECTLLYFDLDNFKAYNDTYGFEKGDQLLRGLGSILQRTLILNNQSTSFLGHIGGDDFVILLDHYEYEPLCHQIIQEFDASIVQYYSSGDLERGYLIAENRNQQIQKFSLVTLSISVITNHDFDFTNIDQLTMAAAMGKKCCKQMPGSNLFAVTRNNQKQPAF